MDERGLIWLVQGEFKIGFESKELETRESQTHLRLFSITDEEEAASNPTALTTLTYFFFLVDNNISDYFLPFKKKN